MISFILVQSHWSYFSTLSHSLHVRTKFAPPPNRWSEGANKWDFEGYAITKAAAVAERLWSAQVGGRCFRSVFDHVIAVLSRFPMLFAPLPPFLFKCLRLFSVFSIPFLFSMWYRFFTAISFLVSTNTITGRELGHQRHRPP